MYGRYKIEQFRSAKDFRESLAANEESGTAGGDVWQTEPTQRGRGEERRRKLDPTSYIEATDDEELVTLALSDMSWRLDADACLLFRPMSDSNDELILERVYCYFLDLDVDPYVATFDAEEAKLRFAPLNGPSTLSYLFNPEWYESLDVPLFDTSSRLDGVIRALRDRDDGRPFAPNDRTIAQVVAEKFELASAQLARRQPDEGQLSHILLELESGLSTAADEFEIGRILLQHAGRLVRADRADLVLWDDDAKDLLIRAQVGQIEAEGVGVQQPVPQQSIIREVWSKGGFVNYPRVRDAVGYFPADSRTQSELVFRIDWTDKAVGVLNMESYREDGFDSHAVKWLRLLSQFAVSAYLRTRNDSHELGLLKQLTAPSAPTTDVLKLALQGVRAYLGYDAGLVYYADFVKRQLICVESIGCEEQLQGRVLTEFFYPFEQRSLACKVFHEKEPYFSDDPSTDKNVSPVGVSLFEIRGSVIGVPLLYEGRAVGVMVVWSRRGPSPQRGSSRHLQPFVQLAAPSIAAKADARFQESMVRAAEDILRIRQSSESDEELLTKAVELLRTFCDRVRLFKYDPNEAAFIGYHCAGMSDHDGFKGLTISLTDNPYARDTAATAITKPQARQYGPEMFGPDPDAERLEKPLEAVWLVAPLVVHQRLYGQVVVDNALTGRAFERRDFEYLNFLATVLAETLANVESVEAMRQRALPVLLRHLSLQDSLEAYVRRFLVFATSGRGLGFSRAIFLRLEEQSKRLVPYDAIGSTCAEDFHRIAKAVDPLDLDEQLRQATKVSDEKLNQALAAFAFRLSHEEDRMLFDSRRMDRYRVVVLQSTGEGALSPLAKDLASLIRGSSFLVAPVRTDLALSGLLVVDRTWQPRDIGSSDCAQLEGFVRLAEFLLTDHARTRRFVERLHDDALIGQIATMPYFLDSTRIRLVRDKIAQARRQLNLMSYGTANSILESIDVQLGELVRATNSFQELCDPERELSLVNVRELILDVRSILKGELGESKVDINIDIDPEVPPIPVYYEALWRALFAVFKNALQAVQHSPDDERRIDVVAKQVDEFLNLDVCDTGPGIPNEVLLARGFKVDAYTTDPEKGLGFGLNHAATAVEVLHGGVFRIMRRVDRTGTKVSIRLHVDGPNTSRSKQLDGIVRERSPAAPESPNL